MMKAKDIKEFAEYLDNLGLECVKTNGTRYPMVVEEDEEYGQPYLVLDSTAVFTFDGTRFDAVSSGDKVAGYFINYLFKQWKNSR